MLDIWSRQAFDTGSSAIIEAVEHGMTDDFCMDLYARTQAGAQSWRDRYEDCYEKVIP